MNKPSITNLSEDLLERNLTLKTSQSQKSKRKVAIDQSNSPTNDRIIEALINDVHKTLGICIQDLHDWIQENPLPVELLKDILHTAKHFQLHPFMGHIDWELSPEGDWEIYIPVDGWITMILREPTFQGITFNQSDETENGISAWMECTIYRSNMMHPITVREYFCELKTNHPVWQHMPRRMMRHKTVQQCARFAFGISDNLNLYNAKTRNRDQMEEIKIQKSYVSGKEFLKKIIKTEVC
jgi:hypothetical protein